MMGKQMTVVTIISTIRPTDRAMLPPGGLGQLRCRKGAPAAVETRMSPTRKPSLVRIIEPIR